VAERPDFTHKPERHGLIGPFSGRQLLAVFVIVAVAGIVLVGITTPLGVVGDVPLADPQATAFVIKPAPATGLRPGDLAPEFAVTNDDGTTYQLEDLHGSPVRLADLRGKGVWVNFFTTWCPPCQSEVPVLRDLSERYKDQGLEVVAISVQETQPSDVQAYADRYGLGYTIGFDGSGRIFDRYKANALPTQFFIGPDGVIRDVVIAPLTEAQAVPRIEAILPAPGASAAPGGSAAPGESASPAASGAGSVAAASTMSHAP
jgi:peroxiredoxin